MISLDGHNLALHMDRYADGKGTCVTLYYADGILAGQRFARLTDNITDPIPHTSRDLISDHFFIARYILESVLYPALIASRVIEIVPGGAVLQTGHYAHRLCAGILPDWDTRLLNNTLKDMGRPLA